jgi:hypothetical protein
MHIFTLVKKNPRKSIIIFLLAMIVIAIIGALIASTQAKQYLDDELNWKKSVSSSAAKNNDLSFASKIIIGRVETPQEVDAQKADCTANTERLNTLKKHSVAPSLAFNPFGVLSGDYREALKNQEQLHAKEDLINQATTHMSDYQKICQFYISAMEIAMKQVRETQAAKQYKLYEGTDQQQNQSCAIDGCLPKDKALWPKLADIYVAYVAASKDYAKLYKDNCFSDTYKKVCALNVKYFNEDAILQEKYNNAIKNGSTFYAGFSNKLEQKYDRLIKDAYAEVKGTVLPESGNPESTVQKNLMIEIEKKIATTLKELSKV